MNFSTLLKLATEYEEAAKTYRSGELPPFGSALEIPVVPAQPYDKDQALLQSVINSLSSIHRDSAKLIRVLGSGKTEEIYADETWDLFRDMTGELYRAKDIYSDLQNTMQNIMEL